MGGHRVARPVPEPSHGARRETPRADRSEQSVEAGRGASSARLAGRECPSARRPRASATRVSREENRARYPRDALVAERRCTHRRMVPLPPMRTEPASFLSFSTSMVTSYESAWVKRRAVSRGARALKGHASVSGGALAIASAIRSLREASFPRQGFGPRRHAPVTPRVSDETSDPKGRLVGLHVMCGVARAKEAEVAGAERPTRTRSFAVRKKTPCPADRSHVKQPDVVFSIASAKFSFALRSLRTRRAWGV